MEKVFCIIDGVKYTEKEFKVWRKAHTAAKPKKKVAKQLSDRQINAVAALDMVKSMKVINSLLRYSSNGYKQWGTSHTRVMNLKGIREPYNSFAVNARKMLDTANRIKSLTKRNDKQLTSLIEKLSWDIEDTSTALNALLKGIRDSYVLCGLANSRCISDNGKRLGLSILTIRAADTISKMSDAVKELKSYTD